MAGEIIRSQTPEERELEKKKAELAALEIELIQREIDLATLRAELTDFESRYLRTVGVLYAELDDIEAQIAEAQARRNPPIPRRRNGPAAPVLRRRNPPKRPELSPNQSLSLQRA